MSDHDDLNFIESTATSIIIPTKDSYFTNDSILKQFERLMPLMQFSNAFKSVNCRVDILVDNATTHTKALVDVNMFAKGILLTWIEILKII